MRSGRQDSTRLCQWQLACNCLLLESSSSFSRWVRNDWLQSLNLSRGLIPPGIYNDNLRGQVRSRWSLGACQSVSLGPIEARGTRLCPPTLSRPSPIPVSSPLLGAVIFYLSSCFLRARSN